MTQDLKEFFQTQFGREPTEKELNMLRNERFTKRLFAEWMNHQLGEPITPAQAKAVYDRYNERYYGDWTYFDIFWEFTHSQSPEETEAFKAKYRRVRGIIEDGEQAIGETTSAQADTPTILGPRITVKFRGSTSRHTEDKALRRVIREEIDKEAWEEFKKED